MPALFGTSGCSPIDPRRLAELKNSLGEPVALDIISDFRRVVDRCLRDFKKCKDASPTVRFNILHDLSNAAETLGLVELAQASDRMVCRIRYDAQSSDDHNLYENVIAAGERALRAIEDYMRHAAH